MHVNDCTVLTVCQSSTRTMTGHLSKSISTHIFFFITSNTGFICITWDHYGSSLLLYITKNIDISMYLQV